MKLFLLGCLAALAAAVTACSGGSPAIARFFVDGGDCEGVNRGSLPTETVELRGGDLSLSIDVEVATTAAEREQGLMCRSRLAAGSGMLFVMPGESTGGFWMFNTYVPLDILYFDQERVIAESATLAPCPRAAGEDDAIWRSRCVSETAPLAPEASYRFVLELPAGMLAGRGIDPACPGDAITLGRR